MRSDHYHVGDVIEDTDYKAVCYAVMWHRITRKIDPQFMTLPRGRFTFGLIGNRRQHVVRTGDFKAAARACERRAESLERDRRNARVYRNKKYYVRLVHRWERYAKRLRRLARLAQTTSTS